MIRTASGVEVRRAPFGGGFVVDAASLTVVEIDEPTIGLLAQAEGAFAPDRVPPESQEMIATGLREGWLIADPGVGPGTGSPRSDPGTEPA